MEFSVNEVNASEKEVEINLPYDEVKSDITEEVKKQAKSIQVPGFRKGKVPISMLKKMYGDALEYEASEKVANSFFWKIAREKDLKPIGQPTMTDLKFEPGGNLNFKVKFETLPSLNISGYKDLSFEIPDYIVSEEEIEREISYILQSNRVLEEADTVENEKNLIDAEIILLERNGEKVTDARTEKMQIDLSAEGISKEIIENALYKKAGETFNFSFKDEHDHKLEDGTEEIHREEYYYQVNILGIKKVVLPELNEELIKKVTKDKVSSETDLRAEIRKDIQNYYDQRSEELTRGRLISEIIKKNDFVPPKSLVENILEEYLKTEEEQSRKSKYPFNREDARQRLSKSAENEVKWYLIKNEIQKLENITVTDEDLKEMAEKDSQKTGIPVDKLISYYKSSNQTEKSTDQKLFEFLKSVNSIKKVNPKEFNANKEAVNE